MRLQQHERLNLQGVREVLQCCQGDAIARATGDSLLLALQQARDVLTIPPESAGQIRFGHAQPCQHLAQPQPYVSISHTIQDMRARPTRQVFSRAIYYFS